MHGRAVEKSDSIPHQFSESRTSVDVFIAVKNKASHIVLAALEVTQVKLDMFKKLILSTFKYVRDFSNNIFYLKKIDIVNI